MQLSPQVNAYSGIAAMNKADASPAGPLLDSLPNACAGDAVPCSLLGG